jgi:hypothetical protein
MKKVKVLGGKILRKKHMQSGKPLLLGFVTEDGLAVRVSCPYCAVFHKHELCALEIKHKKYQLTDRCAACESYRSPFKHKRYVFVLVKNIQLPDYVL